MPPALTGLATAAELKSVYAQRSKTIDEKTVSASTKAGLALKQAGEEADGWRVLRKNKASLRLAKDKPTDRQLEDDVWSLLYRMGFRELNTDRQFSILCAANAPPRQLDIFAKDDETVFIVECTHSKEQGSKSIKALIDKIAAIREDVIKAVHTHYGKEPRLKVKFAIATRNVDWGNADKARADSAGIPIITEDDLDYFNKLTNILKTAARYQFLGRYFRGEKVEGLQGKVPATRGRMGGTSFYNFLISPHELLRVAYISHKAKTSNDDLDTYQRMVAPSRLKAIGSYIDGGGKFPTNIVINFKNDGQLQFDQSAKFGDTATGMLSLPGRYGSAWVIDGQHRLYGYAYAERQAEEDRSVISVLAYENLSTQDEIALFVDINTKQVKVNRNLVNEIISSLRFDDPDPRERLAALRARVSLSLDDYSTSPLRNRVVTVSQDKTTFRCITLTSIADGLDEASLLGTIHRAGKGGQASILPGPLSDVSAEPSKTMTKATRALALYFGLFSSALEEHWKLGDAKGGYLCTNNGMRAILLLFGEIARFVENRDGVNFLVAEPESIIDKVSPLVAPVIAYFAQASPNDVNAFRQRGSSLQSVADNCLHLMSIIYEADPSFKIPKVVDWMNSRDAEGTTQAKQMIDEIQRIIYEDVLSTLQEKYGTVKDAWWLKGVPASVRDSADQQFNKSDEGRDRWQYLYLSNYPSILMYGDNWELFKDYYNFYGKGKKDTLVRWIGRVVTARNITHHAEKGPLSREQVDFVRQVHQLVKAHIEPREKVIDGHRYIGGD